MAKWDTTKAHNLGRGDIVTLDEVTESIVSVSTNEQGRLVIERQGTRPVTVATDELVEVYR
jgi:hypothetical protein